MRRENTPFSRRILLDPTLAPDLLLFIYPLVLCSCVENSVCRESKSEKARGLILLRPGSVPRGRVRRHMGHGERARGALPVNTSRGVPTCAHLDQRNLWLHSGTILTRLASRKKVCHVEVCGPAARVPRPGCSGGCAQLCPAH